MTNVSEERPRVLIVDDEKFIRDILADFLGMEGYVVRTAEDGAAALNELTNAHYDMVISDLKMPRTQKVRRTLITCGLAAGNTTPAICPSMSQVTGIT